MNEPARELAEIVAATRALLDDGVGRGVRAEAREPAATVHPGEQPRPEPAGWTEIAASARATGMAAADRLEQVRVELGDCRRCPLARHRKTIVFGVGAPDADLVVIGEAPGYQEDQQGEPFVGPAGQMLDKMLENVIGLSRAQAYIMNMVKCRPPKNRNPAPDEVEACRPFLEGQFEALQPKVVLVLGSVAFRALFQTDQGIKRNRGQWRDYRGVPVMPTFHPAYLLRQPQDKRLTFADLKEVRKKYDELGGARP